MESREFTLIATAIRREAKAQGDLVACGKRIAAHDIGQSLAAIFSHKPNFNRSKFIEECGICGTQRMVDEEG